MLKKLISVTAVICMLCTAVMPASMAASNKSSFSDVESPMYDWAIDDIEQMTVIGIIKGYTDGTFRPANEIKKIEMLLLMARVAGFTNSQYAPYGEFALSMYEPVLDNYNLGESYDRYKPEVAFLLYKGILDVDELGDYLDDAGSAVKRYEAAILLTKLMGAEEEVKQNTAVALDYADSASIPSKARAYVEYVSEEGLMNGVDEKNFGPTDSVTRAQAAVILRRIIDKLDYSLQVGTVTSISSSRVSVELSSGSIESYKFSDSVKALKNGIEVTPNSTEIPAGSSVLLLFSGDSLISMETLIAADDGTYTGTLVSASINTSYTKLTISNSDDGKRSFMYLASDDPDITYNGKSAKLSSIKSGDAVTVKIKNGVITSISGRSGSRTLSAMIKNVDNILDYEMTVALYDDDGNLNGETELLYIDSDVAVKRNGKSSTLRKLNAGDYVELELEGEYVTSISATEMLSQIAGTIYSIYISSNSSIGIRNGDSENVYNISPNASYVIDNKSANIYDLRLGINVSLNFENNMVISVTSGSTAQANEPDTGIVTEVNSSYGYLSVDFSGYIGQVMLTRDDNLNFTTNVIDGATGGKISADELTVGDKVTVIGESANGVFTANTIILVR